MSNLRKADLWGSNLREADLRGSNLWKADLRGADLTGVNLWNTIGNMREIKSMQIDTYCIAWTKNRLQIGCENHSVEEWKNFDDEIIKDMDGGRGLLWWKKWKDIIFQII